MWHKNLYKGYPNGNKKIHIRKIDSTSVADETEEADGYTKEYRYLNKLQVDHID